MHERNRGKGAAVRTGFEHATGDYVLVQDADLEYDPEDWPRLLAPVLAGKARVVYGSRFTGERRNMLFLHWVGNRFLSLITNVLYNTTLSDMETCYKLDRPRRCSTQLQLQSNGFDIEPEITAKILKRKVRIYEVPISYTGREVDEGKKITWTRRLHRAVDAREVPLPRLTPRLQCPEPVVPESTRWAAVVVNYEAGPLLEQCVRSVLADTSAGPVELVVVDNGSSDGSVAGLERADPGRPRDPRRRATSATPRAVNLGIAATRAPVVAVLERRHQARAGDRGCARRGRSTPTRASPRAGRGLKNLDGTDYPSARRLPSVFVAVDARAARACGGRTTGTPPSTGRLDVAPDEPRIVDWISGAAMWLRRGALDEVGGWDERYFMYLEDVDLLLAAARRGLGDRVRTGRCRRSRAGGEHRAAAVPDARRAPPFRVALRPPPVHGRACAPVAVRGRLPGRARAPWRCASHAWRARSDRGVHRLAWPPYGQVLSDETTRQRPVRRADRAATSAGTSSRPSSSPRASS